MWPIFSRFPEQPVAFYFISLRSKGLKYKPGEYEAMQKPGCMWFCLPCKPKIGKNILNEKVIEERCQF